MLQQTLINVSNAVTSNEARISLIEAGQHEEVGDEDGDEAGRMQSDQPSGTGSATDKVQTTTPKAPKVSVASEDDSSKQEDPGPERTTTDAEKKVTEALADRQMTTAGLSGDGLGDDATSPAEQGRWCAECMKQKHV